MLSTHYIDLIEHYKQLQACLQNLKIALDADNELPAWVQSGTIPGMPLLTDRARAYAIISALEYHDEQAPKEILICPGIIAASDHTLTMIEALNDAKDQFKQTMLMLKQAKIKLNTAEFKHAFEETLSKRTAPTTQALKRTGLQRLHLKQCYRRIPILPEAPKKVSWTWAHTRAIRKINKISARQLLEKKGQDPGILQQLNKLEYLSHDEPIAIIQELAPHLRANIVFHNQERMMIKGPVPIFFPGNAAQMPYFKPPPEKKLKDKNRGVRTDLQIDPESFLPAIHAHRYLAYSKA